MLLEEVGRPGFGRVLAVHVDPDTRVRALLGLADREEVHQPSESTTEGRSQPHEADACERDVDDAVGHKAHECAQHCATEDPGEQCAEALAVGQGNGDQQHCGEGVLVATPADGPVRPGDHGGEEHRSRPPGDRPGRSALVVGRFRPRPVHWAAVEPGSV